MEESFVDKFQRLRQPKLNLCEMFKWFSSMDPEVLKTELNRVHTFQYENGSISEFTVLEIAVVDAETSVMFLCLRFGANPNVILKNGNLDTGIGTILDINGAGTTCGEMPYQNNEVTNERQVMLRAQGAKTLEEINAGRPLSEIVVQNNLPQSFGRVMGEFLIGRPN